MGRSNGSGCPISNLVEVQQTADGDGSGGSGSQDNIKDCGTGASGGEKWPRVGRRLGGCCEMCSAVMRQTREVEDMAERGGGGAEDEAEAILTMCVMAKSSGSMPNGLRIVSPTSRRPKMESVTRSTCAIGTEQ